MSLSQKQLTAIEKFNKALTKIIILANKLFPKDEDIKYARDKIPALIDANPKKAIDVMTPHMKQYKQQIADKNIDFFMDWDANAPESIKEFSNFFILVKEKWPNVSGADRAEIWKFLGIMSECVHAYNS